MLDWDFGWTAMRFFLDLTVVIFAGAIGVFSWWKTKTAVHQAALDQTNERVADLERQVRDVAADLRHIPSHTDLAQIHEKVNSLSGTMREVRGELAGINRTLGLINEYLLNKGSS